MSSRKKKKGKIRSEWAKTRYLHLRTYPECRACDRSGTHVHHLVYRGKRGLSEKPGDLVTLCAECHSDLHREYGSFANPKVDCGMIQHTLDFISRRREQEAIVRGYLAEFPLDGS